MAQKTNPTDLDRAVHQYCVDPENPWVQPIKPRPFKEGSLDLLFFRDPNYNPLRKPIDIDLFSRDLDSFLVDELHYTRHAENPQTARKANIEKIVKQVSVAERDLPMQKLLTLVDELYD